MEATYFRSLFKTATNIIMKRLLTILSMIGGFMVLSATAALASTYTVKSGDTLSKIAPTNWRDVCSHNAISNCNLIYPGQVLDIPDGNTSEATAVTTSVSTGSVPGVDTALASRYVYGGSKPYGFDCSGLAQWISGLRGYNVPRTVSGQVAALPHIALANGQPGDLLAFNYHHVGILLGGGKVLQALNPTQGIRITTIDDGIKYNGYLTTLSVR